MPWQDTEHWAVLLNGNPISGNDKKVIFTTHSTHTGALGGISGADEICQQEADASAGTPTGTYKALLSTSSRSAKDLVDNSNSYYKVDGTLVVDNGFDNFFEEVLQTPLNMTALGQIVTGKVWTNINDSGNYVDYSACQGFTQTSWHDYYNDFDASAGDASETDSSWYRSNNLSCAATARLYCVQQ